MSDHISSLKDEIRALKSKEAFHEKTAGILEMIAMGESTPVIYNSIASLYESRHIGMRCSMLELKNGKLLHGGAPSLPKKYCEAVHGLKNGPNVGSCGTSTYTGERCVVESIEADPKWANLKEFALPHGMRCCWSEPIKDSNGKVLGAFGMYYNHTATPSEEESQDLTSAARITGLVMERDHNQKRIRELAYTDTFTKLPSRAYFYKHVENLIHLSKQHKSQFHLLYIDMDDFKCVNDSLGHDAGDFLLKAISRRLKIADQNFDIIARLSGDEFCVVIKGTGDMNVEHMAQRCIEIVSKPVNFKKNIYYTPACSIGIAHYPKDGKKISALLKAADTALYSAKDLGKNRYAFYELELSIKAERQFYFEQSLRDGVEKKQFKLVYQPQIDIASQKIIGIEALTRWTHPDFDQVSPLEFFKVAERIGVVRPLTEWVLYTACHQAVAWKKSGLGSLKMAVNISSSQFLDKDIFSLLKKVIDETSIEPSMLALEVTESVVQTNPQNLSIFKKLKSLGISIAIDDFGEGYSSFASLKHISIDCLKIGKYFIDDVVTDSSSRSLVSSMVDIGHNLGHTIVAEGVETEKQLNILKALGCETAQGYLFSRPVAAENLSEKLKEGMWKI